MESTSTTQTPARTVPGLYDLPVEVRHQIYKHLFCHKPSPIEFAANSNAELELWPDVWPTDGYSSSPAPPPTFYTDIFRVNKALSRDALQFAYSANSFLIANSMGMERFCRLGDIALASMKSICMYSIAFEWTERARQVWWVLNQRCTNLEVLKIEPSSFLAFATIPYLKDFINTCAEQGSQPDVLLDLYVLDRHFAFETPANDYRQAMRVLGKQLGQGAKSWKGFVRPQRVITHVPKHVKQVYLAADVSAQAMLAFEEMLEDEPVFRFVRTSPDRFPSGGMPRIGRNTRWCYRWKSIEEEDKESPQCGDVREDGDGDGDGD
ncbi:hypothetical protein LTR84_001045 [Exophiala bonariae]|uniref:F-box domain-containing protein n=1 Tax=Exophiala bonariae TaxID=1690606 RepID=A0AAV9NWC7_9EURO|nr:hypothetical protein LTR84_001045 [Exophiala bonariae]